ncbi:MAG: signal peptidase II [Planctomycetota bacterium]|nr:MAG: signal peptidase II [Planctomycetota bacterium]
MTQLNKEEGIACQSPSRGRIKLLCSALPSLRAHLVFWSLMAAGLLLDLWSKSVVFDWLQQQQRDSFTIIDGFLQLVVTENAGAAFGIAAGQTKLLVGVSVIALIAILAIFFFSKTEHALVHAALGLFAAGVCGNLWDRIFNGGMVRDFIDVSYRQYHWPAFNVADSMLCIGVGLLIISSLFTGKSYRRYAQQHK